MSTMRMHLLNSRTVRLNGLGTFTMKARTRGKGTEKAEDVNRIMVTALRCQFTPEYTRPAAIGTTRALIQGVEFDGSGKAQPPMIILPVMVMAARIAEKRKIR